MKSGNLTHDTLQMVITLDRLQRYDPFRTTATIRIPEQRSMFETYRLCAVRKVRQARNNLPSIIGLIYYHDDKVRGNSHLRLVGNCLELVAFVS